MSTSRIPVPNGAKRQKPNGQTRVPAPVKTVAVAPRPRVYTPVKTVSPQKKSKSFDLGDATSDIFNSFTSALNKPAVIVLVALVASIVLTHQTSFATSTIGKFLKDSDNSIAKWILKNSTKFLGMLIFIPALYNLPSKLRPVISIATVFWCLLVPESSIYQYVIQSFSLHTYFKVSQSNTRLLIVGIVGLSYYLGWFSPSLSPAKSPATNGTGV
ncbi:hypothetical protein 3 [Loreto virus]|uniref:Uncharacterized protein n=1 Tax=Loreto virus TaxID=1170422 RepID=M1F497_9VIRU|nr:hypothetical protein 3 [Loreto virus]AFI24689.1 hypothetical protein 3 [Loreto virus]AFI24692.1 hypothetical protein 3 [Loreto virus]AFI24695.1 hypothetical protein 3 [Loreto virus]AQM55313.1 hypothetical protein 3 [Loreto virus]